MYEEDGGTPGRPRWCQFPRPTVEAKVQAMGHTREKRNNDLTKIMESIAMDRNGVPTAAAGSLIMDCEIGSDTADNIGTPPDQQGGARTDGEESRTRLLLFPMQGHRAHTARLSERCRQGRSAECAPNEWAGGNRFGMMSATRDESEEFEDAARADPCAHTVPGKKSEMLNSRVKPPPDQDERQRRWSVSPVCQCWRSGMTGDVLIRFDKQAGTERGALERRALRWAGDLARLAPLFQGSFTSAPTK